MSARRWPVAADKPGCQPWRLLAPLDAEWYLPDTRGQAGRRKRAGWHHLGSSLLSFPTPPDLAKDAKLWALHMFVPLVL